MTVLTYFESVIIFNRIDFKLGDFAQALFLIISVLIILFVGIKINWVLGFALGFIIKGFMENPKNQMKIIIAFAAMLILLVGSYLLSSGTDIPAE